jgi:transcriptional regulator with XRE-family HTH domain
MFFSLSQIRAACGLLDWSASNLAEKIGVSKQMMSAYLAGKSGMSSQNLEKMAHVLDVAGIDFTPEDGVKRKSLRTQTFHGQAGMIEFMRLVYEEARDRGGEFCVSNVDETIFTERFGQEEDALYTKRMSEIKDRYKFKVLIKEGDQNFVASEYAEYRWIPAEQFHSVPFYVFGNSLAFLIFGEQTTIHVIHNAEVANAQRSQFNLAWEEAKIPHA